MKTLKDCKDEIAVKNGFISWAHANVALFGYDRQFKMLDEAAELYASQFRSDSREPSPRDEDEFYLYLLREIVDYEKSRDKWPKSTDQYLVCDLVVTQLQKVKARYVSPLSRR